MNFISFSMIFRVNNFGPFKTQKNTCDSKLTHMHPHPRAQSFFYDFIPTSVYMIMIWIFDWTKTISHTRTIVSCCNCTQ